MSDIPNPIGAFEIFSRKQVKVLKAKTKVKMKLKNLVTLSPRISEKITQHLMPTCKATTPALKL